MKILGIIPARGGSKRLKNKNSAALLGRPLISYTIEHAKASKLIDRVVCSTDSEEIAKIALTESCEVITRPRYLATDNAHIADALIHAADYMDKKFNYKTDIAVILIPNVPVREPGIIDKVIQKLINTRADSVFTVEPVGKYHPNWMVKADKNDRMVYYSPTLVSRAQDLPALYINNGAVLAVWADVLKRRIKRKTNYSQFGNDIRLIVQNRCESVDIDDIYDFIFAEAVLRHRQSQSKEAAHNAKSSD